MGKSTREKKKYFKCSLCGTKHKIAKVKGEAISLIQCNCGCSSWIQIKNGYHIPSKEGLRKTNPIKINIEI